LILAENQTAVNYQSYDLFMNGVGLYRTMTVCCLEKWFFRPMNFWLQNLFRFWLPIFWT